MSNQKIGTVEAIMMILAIVVSHTLLYLPKNILSFMKSASILNIIYVLKIMEVFFKYGIMMIMIIASRAGQPGACSYKHCIRLPEQFCRGSDALCSHFISPLKIFLVSVNTFAISSRIAIPLFFSSSGTMASRGLMVI